MKNSNQQTLTRKGFENMVENALKAILENADNTQYNSLHAMHERMNDVEFDNHLSKERERFLQGDVLKKYDFLKQNGLPSFEAFASMVAHEIEKSEEGPVNWSDKWKKSAWKENDFASAYLEGIRLEGMVWATNDFGNRVFNLTFESWENGEWPISEQPMVGKYTYRYGNHYRVCTLSMDEYKKIVEAQKTILQKLVDLFLKGQTDDFNRRFAKSGKKEELFETEKKKVGEWLSNKDLSGAYSFPNPNGGTYTETDLGGLFREEGQDKNLYPYWYDRILVQGNEAHVYIKPEHESARILIPAAAVLVLDKYMMFLENRQNVNEVLPDVIKVKGTKEKDLPTLEDAVKDPEQLPQLWKALSKIEKPFVSESGKPFKMKQPHAVLMAFAQTLSTKDKVKEGITVDETYLILCRFFDLQPASRPDKAIKTHRFKDYLNDLTDCM